MAEKSNAQTDYEAVAATADRLKLKGNDREDYIRRHMRGFGHKAVTNWVDDDGEDGSGGFFGRRDREGSGRRSRFYDDDEDGH